MTSTCQWWRIGGFFLGAVVVALADLATKVLSVRYVRELIELTDFLSLTVVRNPGVAFGLGTGLPPAVLLVVTIAVAILLVWLVIAGQLESLSAAALVLGGALANIVDRAGDGSVVDVVDVGWWPTFNLADVTIVSGEALMFIHSFRADDTSYKTPSKAKARDGG